MSAFLCMSCSSIRAWRSWVKYWGGWELQLPRTGLGRRRTIRVTRPSVRHAGLGREDHGHRIHGAGTSSGRRAPELTTTTGGGATAAPELSTSTGCASAAALESTTTTATTSPAAPGVKAAECRSANPRPRT